MASWQARLAAFFVRHRIKPALGDMRDIARVRAVFATRLPVPRGRPLHGRHAWAACRANGSRPPIRSRPARRAASRVLYLHGGGFIGCSARTHRPLTASIALQGCAPVRARLPARARASVPGRDRRCLRGLARAAERATDADARLTVAGDSAGGNLALALMLVLRDAGEPLARSGGAVLARHRPDRRQPVARRERGRDALFDRAAIDHVVATYLAGADPTQPLASPLLGDLRGLPPLLVHVGADELMRDDSVRLAEKARAAGVAVELKVWPGRAARLADDDAPAGGAALGRGGGALPARGVGGGRCGGR